MAPIASRTDPLFLSSDLSPLFNWNTKQVFVSLVAEYDTKTYVRRLSHRFSIRKITDARVLYTAPPLASFTILDIYSVSIYPPLDSSSPQPANSVVVWDRIVRSPKQARFNVQDGKQKYEFKEITDTFRCVLNRRRLFSRRPSFAELFLVSLYSF